MGTLLLSRPLRANPHEILCHVHKLLVELIICGAMKLAFFLFFFFNHFVSLSD